MNPLYLEIVKGHSFTPDEYAKLLPVYACDLLQIIDLLCESGVQIVVTNIHRGQHSNFMMIDHPRAYQEK